MFKNATLYRIIQMPSPDYDITAALQAREFLPCGASQEVSHGWVPPRGEYQAMCECINGNLIYKLMTETKTVPTDVLDRKVKERAAAIEASTGRKPGRKETRDLKDDIRLELLPMAFAKRTSTLAWINPEQKLLVIDTASTKRADEVVTALIQSQEGLVLQRINTQVSPVARMADWLTKAFAPETLSVDRDCVLASMDESKAKVKYVKHNLDIQEVVDHIHNGMMPESLAVTWLNRVSFVLTGELTLKNIAILDVEVDAGDEKVDEFDASICIMTAELLSLTGDLIDELGGEVSMQKDGQ